MHTKKIAIVTPYGAEPRLDNYAEFVFAQHLIKKGWDVRLYTYASRGLPTYDKDLIYKGVPVFRCRERLGISPRLLLLLLSFRPCNVFCFHPRNMLNFSAFLAARCMRARFSVEIVGLLHDPYVVSDVDDPVGNLYDPPNIITSFVQFLGRALQDFHWLDLWRNYVLHAPTARADTIVAINKDEQKYIQKIYGRDSALVYWSTPTLDVSQEQKPSTPLPDEYLFFIGQTKRRKGWDTAIEALAYLRKENVYKQLIYVAPVDDLVAPKKLAAELNVLDQITFLVGVSNEEKNWLYAHCLYVLIPSRYEGFGLPVFEAFLAKKPICATDIPVFLEFLEHKKNAMISSMGSGEDMARNVLALDNDPELVRSIIEEGKETAEDFSAEKMVNRLLNIINKK